VTPDQKHPVSVDFAGRNRLARGQLWDISTSGIAVNLTDTAERWEVGNQIELVIHFPGQLPFSAQGKVRHQTSRTLRDQVIGIEFLGLADALKDEVFGFVNTRL
jgi:c-di-GMP-binding flagellar brake protein YcgR